ncbi:hypothetical protein [Streptomyces sp. NPDC086777]|uniref:hypothetical protein n=1 Tax=Streptomyces sp. NPDC086777 TaxID=3154866 RepID=UPI00344E8373
MTRHGLRAAPAGRATDRRPPADAAVTACAHVPRLLFGLLGGAAPALSLLGTVRLLGALVARMLVFGGMDLAGNVNQVTLMQQRAPGPVTGRIAAALRAFSTSGVPLGGAVVGACGLTGPAAGRRPPRPGRHLVDTGAQAGRTCCCAVGRRDGRPCPRLIN